MMNKIIYFNASFGCGRPQKAHSVKLTGQVMLSLSSKTQSLKWFEVICVFLLRSLTMAGNLTE